ncbi:hypothetical protein F444_13099 [Phytophthora nicotianae P1976]|uniref:Chitin-binding type-4 domain-containing protein n=1 Tax=Phytophthora nicotianae P1976 TaxID=1317066 RepID=A0A080ZUX3_PHYNI|nr:hypothetical protein F444_13099 [Phytophthora nicotianae P1976]
MQPTGIVSLAMVATAAVLFTTADAHGQMLVPDYRQISAKFRKDSGALSQAGDQELQYAPVENLSGRSQKDFPEAATFNLMNGCRGTVYEEGNNVTTLKAGADFDVKWIIQAPHPGTMKLSIVKPSEDSTGKITYKNYKTILTVDPFAQNGGEDGTTATMPTDVTGCDSAGDCALQFYWHSDIANQTYPTCADIIVSGSGAGTSTNTKVTTAPTASSLETSDAGSSAQTTPSSNTTPSTEESADGSSAQTTPTAPSSNTTPSTNTTPTPATEAPEATTAPSTPTTESSAAGESDTNKCSRRMRRH